MLLLGTNLNVQFYNGLYWGAVRRLGISYNMNLKGFMNRSVLRSRVLLVLRTIRVDKILGYGLLLGGLINCLACSDEPNLAIDNKIRIENGFNPARPTIIFFGGGNCTNSWEGTEAWENEETFGDAWFEQANVISFHSYRKDHLSDGITYFDAAKLVVDSLLALSSDYHQDVQVCGFSTGGTPALDLALYVKNKKQQIPFRITHITLMDAPCYEYHSRIDSLMSANDFPMIVNLIGSLFKEYRSPYPGLLNVQVMDGHDQVFWWYVNSITTEQGNSYNNGITAGAYLSVIGEGKDIRIPYNKDQVEYFFEWQGDLSAGKFLLFDKEKYPKTLSNQTDTISLFNVRDFTGWTEGHDNWFIQEGMFVGSTMDGILEDASWITTESNYRDFELSLWVRLLGDENRNSGVYYRGNWDGTSHDRVVVGYEFDLGGWGDEENENWWGELHDPYRRPDLRIGPGRKVIEDIYKPEGWNHVKIRAEGNHIRHWLNDRLMVDWEEQDEQLQKEGFIGFQMHDASRFEVQFKDIKLVPLNE